MSVLSNDYNPEDYFPYPKGEVELVDCPAGCDQGYVGREVYFGQMPRTIFKTDDPVQCSRCGGSGLICSGCGEGAAGCNCDEK